MSVRFEEFFVAPYFPFAASFLPALPCSLSSLAPFIHALQTLLHPSSCPHVHAQVSAVVPVINRMYIIQYIIITPLFTQVSVAVLLDNFITASSQMELEEKQRETESLLREAVGKNPLEPLLTKVQIEMNHIICTIQ